VKLAQYALLWLLGGAQGFIGWVITLSLVGLVQLIISCLTAVVLLHAVLSWIQPGAMNTVLLDRLCQPWLAPIRRLLPSVGGVDLSSLVLLVALQIASMVVGSLQTGWMH
jgi:YggT family protein